MKKIHFLVLVAFMVLTGCGAAGGSDAPQVASNPDATTCVRTEQSECIEFDLLNIRWEEGNTHLVGLDEPYGSYEERVYRATELGPILYEAWKDGAVDAADTQTYTVYVWNPATDVSADRMSQYRPRAKNGADVTRHGVVEVSTDSFVAAFDPLFDLGQPDRAFQVTATSGVVAFQVPWEFIGPGTYILICGDDENVYPDRQDADEGLWVTPEYLAFMKGNRRTWVLVPFVSKS